MTTETRLLEMLGHGAPMLEVLNELCNFIDTQSPGAISTVFLLDSDGIRLRPVAGPKAPKTWKEEIDNLEEGPYAGFCSTSGEQARALTVGDIDGWDQFPWEAAKVADVNLFDANRTHWRPSIIRTVSNDPSSKSAPRKRWLASYVRSNSARRRGRRSNSGRVFNSGNEEREVQL